MRERAPAPTSTRGASKGLVHSSRGDLPVCDHAIAICVGIKARNWDTDRLGEGHNPGHALDALKLHFFTSLNALVESECTD